MEREGVTTHVYAAQPGRRDVLAARFASSTDAIFARHRITVRYWIPQQSRPKLGSRAERTFTYTRGYRFGNGGTSLTKSSHEKADPSRAGFVFSAEWTSRIGLCQEVKAPATRLQGARVRISFILQRVGLPQARESLRYGEVP